MAGGDRPGHPGRWQSQARQRQRLVERFEPWYLEVADRPQITTAPAAIAHNQPFRPMSTTHQISAAEGDFTLTAVTTPAGPGWSLTISANLTPPGYYYLVAVDSRDIPSPAKIIKIT